MGGQPTPDTQGRRLTSASTIRDLQRATDLPKL